MGVLRSGLGGTERVQDEPGRADPDLHGATGLGLFRYPPNFWRVRIRALITWRRWPRCATTFAAKSADLSLKIDSPKTLIERMHDQMRLFTLLLGAVGGISLLVGGIGIMNVMLISITERRLEIGIRRALGARRRDIQGQFLIESIILSLLGGAMGLALGIGASYVICQFTNWTFVIPAMSIVLGVGVATAAGLFFGYYPAWQAARLDPIAALRGK